MNASATVERIKLTDAELSNLLTRPVLVLRSATHVVRQYAGKFEMYTIDADGLETFVGYMTQE